MPTPDCRAVLTGDVTGLTIGVPWSWFEELPLSAATAKAFSETLSVFKSLGADIHPVSLPPLRDYDNAKKVIAVAELIAIHAQDLRTRPELFGASLRYRVIAGGLVRAEEYILAMRARTDLARAMQTVMATVDVMMLPTQEPAARLEPVPPESLFTKTSFTTPFNVGGNPALALCNGYARIACRSPCKSSASCSMTQPCCAPVTPMNASPPGARNVRRWPRDHAATDPARCPSHPRAPGPTLTFHGKARGGFHDLTPKHDR